MATTVMSDITSLPKFYSKVWLERLLPGPVLMEYCTKKPLEQGNGNTIYFPRMLNRSFTVSAAKQTDGTVLTTQKIQDAQVSAVIEQYADGIGVSDLTELTAINSTITEAMGTLADQAKNVLDRRIIEEAYGTSATPTGAGFSCFAYNTVGGVDLDASTSAFGTYVGTAEYRMKASTVRAAVKKLTARNVRPFDGRGFALVVHSDTAFRLQADTEWQNAYIYTDPENVKKGIAGKYANAEIVVDNNIYTSANGSSGATLYYSILIGQGALGATELDGGVHSYVKRSGDQTTSDPANQLVTLAWKANFVPKRLNVSCGIVVITAD